jgi:hypothetical protein
MTAVPCLKKHLQPKGDLQLSLSGQVSLALRSSLITAAQDLFLPPDGAFTRSVPKDPLSVDKIFSSAFTPIEAK